VILNLGDFRNAGETTMLETTATKLIKNLSKEVEPCFNSHEALHVKQRDGKDFVIISAEAWRAIEETLFLNQIPGMVASIHDAANEPLDKGVRLHDLEKIKQ
jgi:Phd_YefM.